MIKGCWIVLLLFLILAGCRVGDSMLVVSTTTPISTALPSATAAPPMTHTAEMPTIPSTMMSYQCLEITNNLPADDSLQGVIVYNGDYNLYSFLSNQETDDTYLLPREEGDILWQFGVSSDGKHVKYIHSSVKTNEDQLVIATAEGQPIWSQVIDSIDWEWFDNEHLVHSESLDNGTHVLLLLNPFSGEQQYLPVDFPDSVVFSSDWYGHWYYARRGLPIYDPTLTRVVYPAIEDKQKWPIIIIWNTETNQKVAQILAMDYWGNTPLWTPDGKQFIIATNMDSSDPLASAKELFAVSRDGEVRQITHFSNSFSEIRITDNYSLSPNGKLLAFWVLAKPGPLQDASLTVLNIESGEVTNYCIRGDPFADNVMEPSPPVWSPDSTQLLIISRVPEDTKVRRVVVVDTVNNYAAQIAEDIEPVGWMAGP